MRKLHQLRLSALANDPAVFASLAMLGGFAILAILMSAAPVLAQGGMTDQIKRGEELFHQTAKPVPCSTCHEFGGKGTAVGPNLSRWARVAPRATAIAIVSTVTENVVMVKSRQGNFVAIRPNGETSGSRFYDLREVPPVLRTINPNDLIGLGANNSWRHPYGKEQYTSQQLADLIAYIRFVGAKDTTPVAPGDVK
jgi:hypothetical protein